VPIVIESYPNASNYIACRTHSASRIVLLSFGTLEDLDGAIAEEDFGVARSVGQDLVLQCSAIRSAFVTGRLFSPTSQYEVGFDPFAGLDRQELLDCLDILARLAACNTVDALHQVASDVRQFFCDTEKLIDWNEPLPNVRKPGGMFPALRMMRDLNETIDRHRLPPLIPQSWTEATDIGAAG
jgi:hypothetical protein